MNFPVLSKQPSPEGFSQKAAIDPTIRSSMESGRQQTRPRFTKVPRQWSLSFTDMTLADVQAVEAFEESVGYGGGDFVWTHPVSDEQVSVRFAQPVEISAQADGSALWQISMVLVEKF